MQKSSFPPSLYIDHEIELKMISPDDSKTLFKLIDRNRDYLREWLPWLDLNQSAQDSSIFVESAQALAATGQGMVTMILFKQTHVGVIGFNWIDTLNRSCEIGYWLAESHQKAGIITKCTRRLIEFAFTNLNLNRISIPVAVENAKSRAIAIKLGFVEEGTLREAEWLYDHYVDHVMYSLLRSDWQSQK